MTRDHEDRVAASLQRRRRRYQTIAERAAAAINRLALARGLVFTSLLLLGWFWSRDSLGLGGWTGAAAICAALAAFFYLMVRHDRLYRLRQRLEVLDDLCRDDIARVGYRFQDLEIDDPIPFGDDHPFAHDLDLDAPNGVPRLLDNTFHLGAKALLKRWMEEPPEVETVRARREAAADLAKNRNFRLRLAAAARLGSEPTLDPDHAVAWLSEPRPITIHPLVYGVGRINSLLVLASLGLNLFAGIDVLPWWPFTILQIALFYGFDRLHAGLNQAFLARGRAIGAAHHVLRTLCRMRASSPRLLHIQRELAGDGADAAHRLRTLMEIHERLAYRSSGTAHFLVNLLFLWDQHQLWRLERIRRELNDDRLRRWIEWIFEVEALCAIANFKALYGYPFPELLEAAPDDASGGIFLQAKSMGHPAIPSDRRVVNDYELPEAGRLHLVTGSNMSGKSTFLRTIGVNMVLARLGAPVCAQEMRCTLPDLRSSIRIQDSLADGVSYFYAEVRRLKQVVDAVRGEGRPVLYLLDELLKGTNSRERLIATRALVEFLIQHQASGLITTHDLEMLALREAHPDHIENYHFQEDVRDGEMTFDYKLKPGRLTSTNALRLLKMAGVELPLPE